MGKQTTANRWNSGDQEAETPQFALLQVSPEERRRRWASLGMSVLVQIPALALVVWFLSAPRVPSEREGKSITVTLLAPPPATFHPPRRIPAPLPARRLKQAASLPTPPVFPRVAKLRTPKPRSIPLPLTQIPVTPQAHLLKPAVPKWKPRVHVGAFKSAQTQAMLRKPRMEIETGGFDRRQKVAMLNKSLAKIQTGGFGAPNGLPDKSKAEKQGNFTRLGSFGDPEGPGLGNGAGGSKGARGFVASVGFGSGVAPSSPSGNSGAVAGQTHPAGFASARSLNQASPRSATQQVVAAFEPVVISFKPNPVYPEEAKRLHIQGEVVLRVDFEASGKVQVLNVEHGLGRDLDRAAMQAARQIQFKPARRKGQPVNTIAILRIFFRLAD